ncbi:MAG: hypothetical protein WCK46_03220 [Candidatus Adlerbacteria bacterium]
MKIKILEKKEASRLRKKGYSLGEISTKLNISKGTASLWLKHVLISSVGKSRIKERRAKGAANSRQAHLKQTTERLKEASLFAGKTLSVVAITPELSRISCALMYWCEGEKSKNDKSLTFTNSDPLLVKSFLKNLRAGFPISEEKFRVCVHLHSYHNKDKQLLFWSKVTSIPLEQFVKPYQKMNSGKNIREGYAGCASIRYHDVKVARQVHALARAFLQI